MSDKCLTTFIDDTVVLVQYSLPMEVHMKKFLVFVVVAFLAGCVKPLPQTEIDSADYGPFPMNYQQVVEGALKANLFDPYSAVISVRSPERRYFKGPFSSGAKFGWGNYATLNAKNRYGAYVGEKRYIYLIKNGEIIELREDF